MKTGFFIALGVLGALCLLVVALLTYVFLKMSEAFSESPDQDVEKPYVDNSEHDWGHNVSYEAREYYDI